MSIRYSLDAGLARIHINRPEKRNALSREMRVELADLVERAARDADVRALLMSAEGPSFCAGADLEQFGAEGPPAARQRMQQGGHRLIRALHDIEKPVVVAVRGHVIGLGWALALACDVLIASKTAQFSLPFRRNGLVADTGVIWFLTRELGTLRAKDLVYSARVVGADEALALGLATEVVDDAALESRALDRVRELAAGPTFSLGLMRKLFAVSRGPALADYLEIESLMSPQLRHTEDFHEGIQAFKEKRKPEFRGR
jgi:2-(1,2-epoxy-1,2-dihydrophenyl)acetyl-CoA isomerase